MKNIQTHTSLISTRIISNSTKVARINQNLQNRNVIVCRLACYLVLCVENFVCICVRIPTWGMYCRYRPRFFDQVGHQTTYASIGNRYFFIVSCHHQTYQNYEQSQQKLGTHLENKVLWKSKFSKNFLFKSWSLSLIFFTEKKWERFRWFLILKNDKICNLWGCCS